MSCTVEKDWVTHAGLRAVVLKHGVMGHLMGYVAVPKEHSLFGKHYDDVGDIDVHGDLTYSNESGKYPVEAADVWWFGYDCMHYGDRVPMLGSREGVYRDLAFCEYECESLAKQLGEKK